jgi:hypothetical protein
MQSKNVKMKTYETIFLPVLYRCETWSFTLREEYKKVKKGKAIPVTGHGGP